ncbi:MAG: 50S ribosomal protein L21 [Phycisphaerales bacterium]|nr:50S ribosomal protein L21 [Phycisphaerales bacterium]
MYAIIEDSGSQIKVTKGDVLQLDHRHVEDGAEIVFDRVLMTGSGEGDAKIGQPYLSGAKVTGKVVRHELGEKLDVYKFRRRTGYKRKTGHRQPYIAVEITDIKG